MPQPIHRVDVVTKTGNKQAFALGFEIRTSLEALGVSASIFQNSEYENPEQRGKPRPDMVLVLGGDGTLLSVVRTLGDRQVPVLGMNFGQVGFLTELSPEGWQASLEKIVLGDYHLSPRIMLHYDLLREGSLIEQGRVANDLLVGRGGTARLIRLRLWAETAAMGTVRADGLIVSTPVGSTAYAAAAGGALISHELKVMEICAVCPFMSGFKPLILPSRTRVTIQVEPSSSEVYLTLDGQSGTRLRAGDRITIRESQISLQSVQLARDTYIQKLCQKGYL